VTVASGTQTFTPFLLPGDSDRPVCTGDALNPFTVGVNPSISICDLTFGITGGLSIDPNLDYCVEGDSLDVVQTFDEKQLTQEGDSIRVPAQGAGADFMATWNGTSSLAGSLTVSPTIGITIPVLGDLNVPLPSFPFNLGTINGDTFNLDAPFRIAYPDIDADDTEIMFDDTELGMTSEFTRTIANMGEAPLELIEIVTDNAAFSVLMPETPETVEPGESVDAVIMFAPDAAGTADGMLTIMSNDPDETALSIALTANGVEAPGEGDGEGDGDGDGDGTGGGCPASASSFAMRSSGTPFNADLLAVLLAAGLLAIAPRKETRRH
jgi:hypothetical protein